MSSQNPIVLITGASSGLGEACSEFLLQRGYEVIGTSRSTKSLQFNSEHFHALELDIADESSVNKAVEFLKEKFDHIDVLINNAGTAIMGAAEDTTVDEAKKVFETNFFGVMRLTGLLLPLIRKGNQAKVINVSSVGGQMGLPFRSVYSASKFALEGYTEALRLELEPFGIKVCMILPGDMKTNISQNRATAQKSDNGSVYKEAFEKSKQQINDGVAHGSSPEMVAKIIEKVIRTKSPRMRYIIGKPIQRWSVRAKQVLPDEWFEKILKTYYKL